MKQFPDRCERCDADLRNTASIMSRFSTETICTRCEKRERVHPKYQEAHDRELAQVRAGNMNYEGIGTPPELYRPISEAETVAIDISGRSVEDALAIIAGAGGVRHAAGEGEGMRFDFADGTGLYLTASAPVKAVVHFPEKADG